MKQMNLAFIGLLVCSEKSPMGALCYRAPQQTQQPSLDSASFTTPRVQVVCKHTCIDVEVQQMAGILSTPAF